MSRARAFLRVAAILVGLEARAMAQATPDVLVAPTALMQGDFQAHPPGDAEGYTGFSLARFRLGVYSNPAPWILALAQAEFVGSESPAVLDAYLRVGPWHGLRLIVGYSRSPLFGFIGHRPAYASACTSP